MIKFLDALLIIGMMKILIGFAAVEFVVIVCIRSSGGSVTEFFQEYFLFNYLS